MHGGLRGFLRGRLRRRPAACRSRCPCQSILIRPMTGSAEAGFPVLSSRTVVHFAAVSSMCLNAVPSVGVPALGIVAGMTTALAALIAWLYAFSGSGWNPYAVDHAAFR